MLAALCVLGTGCQQQPITDPVGEALGRDGSTPQRLRAIQATPDSDARGLMPLVYTSGHPTAVRMAAVERMLAADADAFWDSAGTNIRRIDDWPMLTMLCDKAAAGNRVDFIPALIQSWARPSIRYDDDSRPEREAIAKLSPYEDVSATLMAAVARSAKGAQARRVQEAAWTVLSRIEKPRSLTRRMRNRTPTSGLEEELKTVAWSVDTLPRNREELLRMHTLIAASTEADWERRAGVLRNLGMDLSRPRVELRHLPAIDHAEAYRFERPRRDQLDLLAALLDRGRHVSRGADESRANIRATPDRLADHADQLGWGDLLVLESLLTTLDDPAVVAALFEQADRDRLDKTTEHGGVLTWDGAGGYVAVAYEPLMRRHDEVYIASDDCVAAMHTGLAHYHFHAQRHDNADWAGPGGGDFRFADNLHANCVVFTFIDRDTLNADAYFPGEIVIDLGCLRR